MRLLVKLQNNNYKCITIDNNTLNINNEVR